MPVPSVLYSSGSHIRTFNTSHIRTNNDFKRQLNKLLAFMYSEYRYIEIDRVCYER